MSRVNGGPAPTSPAPCTRCHCKTLSCSWKALTTRTKKFNFLQKFYQLRKIIFPNGRVNILPLDLIRRLRWLPDEFLPNWDDWRDLEGGASAGVRRANWTSEPQSAKHPFCIGLPWQQRWKRKVQKKKVHRMLKGSKVKDIGIYNWPIIWKIEENVSITNA